MPGRGKSFDAFQADQAGCKTYASNQVSGQADSANQRAIGAALLGTVLTAGLGSAVGGITGDAGAGAAIGAAAGAGGGTLYGAATGATEQAGIQQRYDNAFAQCMFARGDQVPGFAPSVAASGGGADPLVRSTQGELIRLGYLHGGADGYIGEKTRSAIAAFEQGAGLPADGAPSPGLLAKLQSTPAGGSTATASASSDWVAPAGAKPASTAPAGGWVAPTNAAPAVIPAAATSGGWVAPTKTE